LPQWLRPASLGGKSVGGQAGDEPVNSGQRANQSRVVSLEYPRYLHLPFIQPFSIALQ
jgi:hypothetical protein